MERFKFRVFDKETGKYYKTRISKGSGCTVYQHPGDKYCPIVDMIFNIAPFDGDWKDSLMEVK